MTVKVTRSGQTPSPKFDRPILLLVEGGDDSAFVEKLLTSTSAELSRWQVHEMGGNVTNWRGELDVILSTDEFDAAGSAVGLMMDADADPEISMRRCQDILGRNHLPRPAASATIASDERWRTGIYLLPGQDRTGALEHLIIDIVEPVRVELADQYLRGVKEVRGAPFRNEIKSLIQAYLAGERTVVKTLKNAIEKNAFIDDPVHDSLQPICSFLAELEGIHRVSGERDRTDQEND